MSRGSGCFGGTWLRCLLLERHLARGMSKSVCGLLYAGHVMSVPSKLRKKTDEPLRRSDPCERVPLPPTALTRAAQ